MKYALMEATSKRTYKCPYCTQRFIREKLVTHIDDKHHDLIPEGFSALRVAYNYINNTTGRKCVMCGKPTAWNEIKGRYERLCSEECKKAYLARTKANYRRKYGTDSPTSNPELNSKIQRKALANRKISGLYKFSDGGEIGYVGDYEKKFLEFMDKIMKINSEDLQEPGPDIIYQYKGENHLYIPDYYYIPYNLIIEIKRGGEKNPDIYEYKEKTVAKEEAVRKLNKYNYLRLTNNDFSQVMSMFGLLKYDFDEKSNDKIMRIYESTLYDDIYSVNEAFTKYEKNHVQKGELKLSSFKRMTLSKNVVDKYKSKAKYLKHTMINDSCKGYLYIDKEDDPVCVMNVESNKEYIQQIEISQKYQGYGLSKQILDICVNELGAKELSVVKSNTVAVNVYKKYGFVIYMETDKMYFMKLKKYMGKIESHLSLEAMENPKLYFVSSDNMDNNTLHPRVPNNFLTKNGYEDNKTPRVCLSTSIKGCLMGLSQNLNNKEMYVHVPVNGTYEVVTPSVEHVPDVKLTGERWVLHDVKLKCIGKILVKDDGKPGKKYKYGNNTAELFSWDYEWLEKYKNSSTNETAMSGTIAAALAPSPVPSFADKNNYYIIQHMQNNVYDYSITKDPMQYTMLSIDPEKGYKVFKSDKGKIEKNYLTFKMKDSKKAKEVYDEIVNMCKNGKCAPCNDYVYYRYTNGNHILDESQLMFDNRLELIPNFYEGIQSMEEALYNYLTPSKLDILEEKVDELGGIIYGK